VSPSQWEDCVFDSTARRSAPYSRTFTATAPDFSLPLTVVKQNRRIACDQQKNA